VDEEVKATRTETVTKYQASKDGDLLICVYQRTDTLMWVVQDWTGPTYKWEEFDTRDAAEAAAKKLAEAAAKKLARGIR
jgi:hypothetical protein